MAVVEFSLLETSLCASGAAPDAGSPKEPSKMSDENPVPVSGCLSLLLGGVALMLWAITGLSPAFGVFLLGLIFVVFLVLAVLEIFIRGLFRG